MGVRVPPFAPNTYATKRAQLWVSVQPRFNFATLASTVEFRLEWLEELPGEATDSLSGCVASALVQMPMSMQAPEVLDFERAFPATSSPGEPVRIVGRWPFRDYARDVNRRLPAVERREPEPKILPQVFEAWTARLG